MTGVEAEPDDWGARRDDAHTGYGDGGRRKPTAATNEQRNKQKTNASRSPEGLLAGIDRPAIAWRRQIGTPIKPTDSGKAQGIRSLRAGAAKAS